MALIEAMRLHGIAHEATLADIRFFRKKLSALIALSIDLGQTGSD
jgi:hypothetical protein